MHQGPGPAGHEDIVCVPKSLGTQSPLSSKQPKSLFGPFPDGAALGFGFFQRGLR